VTYSRPWLALVLLALFATACSEGGVVEPSLDSGGLTLSVPTAKGDYSISLNHVGGGFRRQNDKFTARNGSGVNANGPWKAKIVKGDGTEITTQGEITCLGHVDSQGVRLGGVVIESSDPALIGATMIATVHDGNPDRSTGLRVYTEGFDALKHCTDGYPTSQITLNGEVTWQGVRTGFIQVN
jgi:hypothetical protein